MLYSDIVPLICVKERSPYLYGDLPFYKIQLNHFMAQDKPFGGKIIPKCILRVRGPVPSTGEGPGAILNFKTFLSFINRLLVTI